ncbi:CRISPR-associated protein Cas2 (plasmid) [Fuscovulum blasticum]|nr:CRISPR-associated protein Cas2 [Fuscovulum blasticum]
MEEGDAVMIWKALADQGFDFATTVRIRHMPADFNGLKRLSFFPRE